MNMINAMRREMNAPFNKMRRQMNAPISKMRRKANKELKEKMISHSVNKDNSIGDCDE